MLRRRTASALHFERNEHNSAIAIFLAMIVALLLAAGAAVDYARVANMREGIEAAVQAASNAAVRAMHKSDLGDQEVRSIAMSHFEKSIAFARHVGTIERPTIKIDRSAGSATVDAKGIVAMTVSRLCGINDISVPATSTAVWAPQSADAQQEATTFSRQIVRRF